MSDVESILQQSPFLEQLGLKLVQRGDGCAETGLQVSMSHLRSKGIMHGGVAATLLDTTMGLAAGSRSPKGYFTVTVQLNVNFTRPAWCDEELRITAHLDHCGKHTAVARGEIRTDSGVLVATGTGTFMFVRDPSPSTGNLPRHADSPNPTST